MRPRVCHCLVTGLLLVPLWLAIPQPALATAVFDDHFTGDSGGMPVGWHLLFDDPGGVAETGTNVSLCRDVAILSDAFVDPSQGTIVITTRISGTDSEYGVRAGFYEPVSASYFLCALSPSDGQLEIVALDPEGGEQHYVAGYLDGYTGGAIQLTLVMEPTAFVITADSPERMDRIAQACRARSSPTLGSWSNSS